MAELTNVSEEPAHIVLLDPLANDIAGVEGVCVTVTTTGWLTAEVHPAATARAV